MILKKNLKRRGIRKNTLKDNNKKQNKKDNNKIIESKKTTNFVQYFKRNIKEWIMIFIAIPGCIIACIGIYTFINSKINKECESLRNNIYKKIDYIRKNFKEDEFIIEGDTSIYLLRLNYLRENTIEYCNMFESTDENKPYSKLFTINNMEALKHEIRRISYFEDSLFIYIYQNIYLLTFLEELAELHTGESPTKLSKIKESELLSSLNDNKKMDSLIKVDFIKYMNETAELINNGKDYKGKLKSALEKYDEIKEKPEYYRNIDNFLAYVIDCEKLFNCSKKNM